MNSNVDFKTECSVFIIASNMNDTLKFHYERPQYLSDEELTKEAHINFNDMKEKKLNNVTDLISIFIARNKEQYNEILHK